MNPLVKNIRVALFLLVIFWMMPTVSLAREMRHLSTADGLSDMLVNTLYKDQRGYIWIGTGSGLDRFDGNHIKNFSFADGKYGINRVNAIVRSDDGDIYVGNHQGLYVLRSTGSELVRLYAEKINFPVNTLAIVGDKLYIGNRQGLFSLNLKDDKLTHKLLKQDALARDNEVTALLPDGDTAMWVLSLHCLYHIDFATGEVSVHDNDLPWPMIHLARLGNKLYVGTNGGGVLSFDIAGMAYGSTINVGNGIVTAIGTRTDDNDHLYIATDGDGIFEYSVTESRIKSLRDSHLPADEGPLASNSVYSMLIDDQGILWVGYYQDGLEYTPHYTGVFDVYRRDGLVDTRDMAVRALAVDGPRKVIGTREGLYYVDESTGRSARFTRPQIGSNLIFAIAPSPNRQLYYFGTYNGGMYVLDTTTLTVRPFDTPDGQLQGSTVFDIEYDRTGAMWVGASGGLYRFKDGKLTTTLHRSTHNCPREMYMRYFSTARAEAGCVRKTAWPCGRGDSCGQISCPTDF